MAKRLLVSIFIYFLYFSVYATHERAGEITYRHLSGLTYEFTITTYTNSGSPADRDQLTIVWGDGSFEAVQRNVKLDLNNTLRKNTYTTTHTFSATGTYTISMEDPNRNMGIINIPNSVNIPFYIESKIIINPFLTYNNSVQLTNPPIDVGCTGVPFYHNPGAVDPDGDSLVYSLIYCRGYDGEVIPGYSYPIASTSISINSQTGDFYWDSPVMQGEYNIAILIEEYRYGVKVGEVVRDMQILITACNFKPPTIVAINDTCVNAGDSLIFPVHAYDEIVSLEAYGDVFATASNNAIFNRIYGATSVTSNFFWATNCLHVRKQPYQITFKATNHHQEISLTSLKTVRITVVCPAPQNLQASAFENTINLSWNPTPCNNAAGYRIYRRVNSYGYIPAHCQTGVPAYTGYVEIGTTDINTTTFIDNNNTQGLLRGTMYCYMVIAYFADMSESYASNEACTFLKNDVPIITNVSVMETDISFGKIELKWLKPTDFDTIQYPGPYYYTINRKINYSSNFTTIATYNSIDSLYLIDSLQNTKENRLFYRIDFYNNTNNSHHLIGSSDIASSVFLNLRSTDRKLILSWEEQTPWENYNYIIYRENNGVFDSIGEINSSPFTDNNLINGQTYCYYVEARGEYSNNIFPRPLINLSQKTCAVPVDNVPPCTSILQGNTDCKTIDLQWTFPDTCDQTDIFKIYLYYRNDMSADYTLLDSISPTATTYQIRNLPSVIGCFSLLNMDSAGNKSHYSEALCFDVDVCNAYKLPNVFSPNGDGINDFFMPFQYDFVESIEMYIYDRWGALVFKTKNPDILWDGTNQLTKQPCVAGVYFYVCDVREYTLTGIRTRYLNGSVTLLR